MLARLADSRLAARKAAIERSISARREKPKRQARGPEKRTVLSKIEKAWQIATDGTIGELKDGAWVLVGMHARCHELVYGKSCAAEVSGKAWFGAVSAARKMIKEEFDGNAGDALEYVRWAWLREQKRHEKRSEKTRLGWRLVFQSRSFVVDYQVATDE